MNPNPSPNSAYTDTLGPLLPASLARNADRLDGQADDARQRLQRAGDSSATMLQNTVDNLRVTIPESLGDMTQGAEDMARRGMDRARHMASQAHHRAADIRHATAERVQAAPVKTLLMAAAVGAATALMLRWLSKPRQGQ